MSFYFDSDDEDGGGDNKFLCPICGSKESYADDAGTLFCAMCFSQSQTQQKDEELDCFEMNGLAARGRNGHFLVVSRSGSRGLQGRSRCPPNDTYDTSKPLPSLEECLKGFTTILRACLKSAIHILHLSKSHSIIVENAVRQTWLAFLQSWQDGAEFYKKYHPEVRISLRDSFLNRPGYKRMLFRFLTNKALQRVRSEKNNKDESDSDNDAKHANFEKAECTKSESNEKQRKLRTYATLPSLLNLYRRKGPKEAALRLSLNMHTVAAFLLSALSKLGVTAPHLAKWIGTGEIPLLNPYKTVFDEEMQSKMDAIAYAFRMDRVPTTELIEFKTKLLLISAGQPSTLITPASVPLLTKRLVSDLSLEPRILNITLALMGENPHPTGEWLPSSLKNLREIKSRGQILAAIVVACKLVNGFESRRYGWDHGSIVPWNDEQVLDVSNPSAYADFVGTHIIAGRPEERKYVHLDFAGSNDDAMPPPELCARQKSAVPIMAGEPNPQEPRMKRLQKYHEWNVKLRKRKALWADANGVEHYVVNNLKSRYEHVHPHYQVLLETMSLLADVKASSIHKFVCILDREIHHICRPWDIPLYNKVRTGRKNRRTDEEMSSSQDCQGKKIKLESQSEASDSSSSDSESSSALF